MNKKFTKTLQPLQITVDLAYHIRHRDSIRNPYISEFLTNQYHLLKTIFVNHQPNNVIMTQRRFQFCIP